jgi:hypothetical protein
MSGKSTGIARAARGDYWAIMTDIPIDTDDYERRFGKPAGRGFWRFRIVSESPAIRDHIFTTNKPVTVC